MLVSLDIPRSAAIYIDDTPYNAVGDGVTDDTAAFVAAREVWKAAKRTNLAPGANSNKLGGPPIIMRAKSYLIKSPQAFMDSGYTTRTAGMEWIGLGPLGGTQILYQPTAPGPLFYNNDAVLGIRFKNISFDCNDPASDWMYSTSAGGAQDVECDNCTWTGQWRYGNHLAGTNNNSEMRWVDSMIAGTWTAFLFSETQDQFLNYWFQRCKVQLTLGYLARMTKGGNLKLQHCDFSGYSPASSNYLFYLEGFTHANGICNFVLRDSRMELKNANALVMKCEWPQGNVVFDNVDMESQVGVAHSPTFVPFDFNFQNIGGPQISFSNSSLMGIHHYHISSSSQSHKKTVSYENCNNKAFRDFYDMFTFAIDSGSNVGGYPVIQTRKCKGLQESFSSVYTTWAATTAYNVDDIRRSGVWVYKCTVAGTSGTVQPLGAGTIVDNTVTWVSQGLYETHAYVTEAGLLWDKTAVAASERKFATIRNATGQWPARISSTLKGTVRVILPPNSIITGITLNLPAGVLTQGSPGTYVVKTDEVSPTTFINFTSPGNLSAGFSTSYSGFFSTGTALDKRSILLEAGTDVTQFALHPALCMVEYLNG